MNIILNGLLGIIIVVGRVVIFVFFWWAFDGVDDAFGDKRIGYQNEFYAWNSYAIYNITQIYGSSSCPSDTTLLFYYQWPGRNSYDEDGVSYDSISKKQFIYWVVEEQQLYPFILCATLYNVTYTNYANINQTCEERNMRSCNNDQFCVPSSYQYCPITDISFNSNGNITLDRNSSLMPIAYFKVDADFVSSYNNKQLNIYPGQPQDQNLKTKLTPVDSEYNDTSFIPVNTINNVLYYSINGASHYENNISSTYNKTLFFRRYTQWETDALGPLFEDAYQMQDSLQEIITLSNTGTITSLVYLLLLCYIVPALPAILRFISDLLIRKLILWDSIARYILQLMLLAQSIYIIAQCIDVQNYSEELLTSSVVDTFQQQNYDDVQELIDGQEPYHIASIAVSGGLIAFEVILWFFLGIVELCKLIFKFFKKRQIYLQIQQQAKQKEQEVKQLKQEKKLNQNQNQNQNNEKEQELLVQRENSENQEFVLHDVAVG